MTTFDYDDDCCYCWKIARFWPKKKIFNMLVLRVMVRKRIVGRILNILMTMRARNRQVTTHNCE